MSPEAVALLCARPDSFATASLTVAGLCWSCGTFDADSARCSAAADGCADKELVAVSGLSWRIGEVFLDVRGLTPGAGDAIIGVRFVEDDFRNVGTVEVPVDDADVDCRNCVVEDFLDAV